MARYKSATPTEIAGLGGIISETGDERYRCVAYGADINTWLAARDCKSLRSNSGLAYTNGRIIAIDDIEPKHPENAAYVFQNYAVPYLKFVRTSKYAVGSGMAARLRELNLSGQENGGVKIGSVYDGSALIVTNYSYTPGVDIVTPTYSYVANHQTSAVPVYNGNGDLVDWIGVSGSYEQTGVLTIEIPEQWESYMTAVYPEGDVPYGSEFVLYGGKTLFNFGNYIDLDFCGQNCRNKYFSFFLGGNEADVQHAAYFGEAGTNHYGMDLGWSCAYVGYPDKTLIENKNYIKYNGIHNSGFTLPVPDYKSIDSVWAEAYGLGIIFKDTAETNNPYGNNYTFYGPGEEVFAVATGTNPNMDNYNVFDTTAQGLLVRCHNFTMSE